MLPNKTPTQPRLFAIDPIPKRQKKLPPVIVATPVPPPAPLIAVAHAPEATADEPDAPSAKVAAVHRAHPAGPTHPEGIVIKIVGITACDQGRSCEEHPYCGCWRSSLSVLVLILTLVSTGQPGRDAESV